MPGIQEIYVRYQDQGFVVLGINITVLDERSEAERFVDELGCVIRSMSASESEGCRPGIPDEVGHYLK
jgi:hypothetical protein